MDAPTYVALGVSAGVIIAVVHWQVRLFRQRRVEAQKRLAKREERNAIRKAVEGACRKSSELVKQAARSLDESKRGPDESPETAFSNIQDGLAALKQLDDRDDVRRLGDRTRMLKSTAQLLKAGARTAAACAPPKEDEAVKFNTQLKATYSELLKTANAARQEEIDRNGGLTNRSFDEWDKKLAGLLLQRALASEELGGKQNLEEAEQDLAWSAAKSGHGTFGRLAQLNALERVERKLKRL